MADATGYIGRSPGDSAVIIARQNYSPTGVQTDFTFNSGYTPGYVDVYLNGVRLIDVQDYTASTGNTVGLTSYANNGDIVEVIAYKAFNVGNVSNATNNFTVGGNLTVSGDSIVSGGSTLKDLHVTGVSTLTGASYFADVTEFVSSGIVTVSNTTDSTSSTTGALLVSGGVGVALSMHVGGNLSVGGTLTYEDVTNVDAIGIVTAQSGVNIVGGGLTVTGVGTFFSDIDANGALDVAGNVSIADKIIHTGDTNTAIRFPSADNISFETSGTERLRISDSSGESHVLITGSAAPNNTGATLMLKNLDTTANAINTIQGVDASGQTTSAINFYNTSDGTNEGYLSLLTRPASGSITEGLRVLSGGGVGIGASLFHLGDDNTSINFATDEINFRTNGGEKLRINSDGIIEMRSNMQTLGNQNIIRFTDTDTSVAAGQTMGRLQWYSSDASGGGACVKAEIEAACYDTTPDANLRFKTHDGSGTTPDERMRIDSTGRVLINRTASRTFIGDQPKLQVEHVNTGLASFLRVSNDADAAFVVLAKSRSAAGAVCQAGDEIGRIPFIAHDGNDFNNAAADIRAYVDTGIGGDDVPGYLTFSTNGGTTSTTERLRITSGGCVYASNFGIGTDDRWKIRANNSNADMAFEYATSSTLADSNIKMVLKSTGRVGVGTNQADTVLSMYGDSNTVWPFTADVSSTYAYSPYTHELQVKNLARDTTGAFAGIYFHSGASADGSYVSAARIAAVDTGNYKSDLVFGTRNTAFKERLRITAKGDIGINTTGVSYSDHIYLAVRGNSTDRGGVVHIGNSDHSVTAQLSIYDSKAWWHTGTAHPLVFGTGGASQMMTLSTAGNLGIGQASPDTLMHLAGNANAIVRLENTNAMSQDTLVGAVEFEKQDTSGAGAGICGGMRCRSDDSYGARTYIAFSTRGNSTGQAATDSERFRITAQGGVTFNGDTSYDNALNDYEEGTFTPSVSSGLSAGQISYNSRSGRYTVIGNVCYFTFHMNIASCSLDSGQLKFGDLPKTAVNNDSNKAGSAWLLISNGNIGSDKTFRVETNTTDLSVITAAGDAYAANSSSLNAGHRQIAFAGFYYLP